MPMHHVEIIGCALDNGAEPLAILTCIIPSRDMEPGKYVIKYGIHTMSNMHLKILHVFTENPLSSLFFFSLYAVTQ